MMMSLFRTMMALFSSPAFLLACFSDEIYIAPSGVQKERIKVCACELLDYELKLACTIQTVIFADEKFSKIFAVFVNCAV